MTDSEELIKIRKLLTWMVREAIRKRDGAEYKTKTVTDVTK